MASKRDEKSSQQESLTVADRERNPSAGKKRTYVVASRYMQQAERSSAQRKTNLTSLNTTTRQAGQTPKKKSPSARPYSVSTPVGETSGVRSFDDGNLSSIVPAATAPAPASVPAPAPPTVKTALVPAFSASRQMAGAKPKDASKALGVARPAARSKTPGSSRTAVSPKSGKKKLDASDIMALDLLYSEEVLLAYKIQEAEKNLKATATENMNMLWALSRKNADLMERRKKLVQEKQHWEEQLKLHSVLTEQHQALSESLPKFRELQKGLLEITDSIDQCHSQVPVKNLVLPEKEEDLVSSLEMLVSELSCTLEDNSSLKEKASQYASAAKSIPDTLEAAHHAMARTEDLMAKLDVLGNKEASVLIQRIQETTLGK